MLCTDLAPELPPQLQVRFIGYRPKGRKDTKHTWQGTKQIKFETEWEAAETKQEMFC